MTRTTNVILTAEEIAGAFENLKGEHNRQAIEDAFERQTPPQVFIQAIARADRWPSCPNHGHRKVYGLQYAYLLQFLICDEQRCQEAARGRQRVDQWQSEAWEIGS